MVQREAKCTPGFVQTFLEVLTNAVDHSFRTKVTEIKVEIDQKSGLITVTNDGTGIDTTMTSEGIRGPELVFGHMLSSSNFEDNSDNVVGQNGVGTKATNIFSQRFYVETVDAAAKPKKLYKQTWKHNMTAVEKPSIERLTGKIKPYTKIEFLPDYARFGMPKGLDNDSIAVLQKCVVDASAVTPPHTVVYLNEKPLKIKKFKEYCSMYVGDTPIVSEIVKDWEVAVCSSPDVFRHISFVNGLCTPRGGKHVDHVATAIAKKLAAKLTTKARTITNKTAKNAVWIFLKCTVPDPRFDSQNKQTLTTPAEKFSSRYEATENFIKSIIAKTNVTERVQRLGAIHDDVKLKKTDGSQRRTVTGIPKLDDASAAGGPESYKCTLILTEGDSAKSTAIAGLAAIGRKYYGVFALKGKPLNPRDASKSKIGDNEEIKNLKKIIGLESTKTYETPQERKQMRYNKIVIAADADEDGKHIVALVCNIFHTLWPALLRQPGFVSSLRTPIVVAKKGKQRIPFYDLDAFERWRENGSSGWHSVFYKGLGLINSEEARDYFGNMKLYELSCQPPNADNVSNDLDVRLVVTTAGYVKVVISEKLPATDDDAFELAFRKNRAEDRKKWLNGFDKTSRLCDEVQVRMKDYINKELAHFSWDDVQRSLPHVVDGLKESQRKILFSLKSRPGSAGHVRVAQMAAYVSQVSAYRHGEASLVGAIVGMAQGFTGCGSVNLIKGEGQFGTRINGGKDHASPRYIHCDIGALAQLMFPPDDEALLQRNVDDDMKPIEARYYIPVLPLLILNGSVGIGTGYSTNVPCFSTKLVAEAYKSRIKGERGAFALLRNAAPFYEGFKGTFEQLENGKWVSKGVYSKNGKNIHITELPIGTWSQDYKLFLEDLVSNNKLGFKRFESNYTDTAVDFMLVFDSPASASACNPYASLKLQSDKQLSMTNMHALNTTQMVKRYESAADIAEEHFAEREAAYGARLELQRFQARVELDFARAKEGFVKDVICKTIDIGNAPQSKIIDHAKSKRWPKDESDTGYDYLLNMPISSLTKERYERLKKDVERKEAKLKELMKATVQNVWAREIDAVIEEMSKQKTKKNH